MDECLKSSRIPFKRLCQALPFCCSDSELQLYQPKYRTPTPFATQGPPALTSPSLVIPGPASREDLRFHGFLTGVHFLSPWNASAWAGKDPVKTFWGDWLRRIQNETCRNLRTGFILWILEQTKHVVNLDSGFIGFKDLLSPGPRSKLGTCWFWKRLTLGSNQRLPH